MLGRRLSEAIIPPRYRAAHERGLSHFLATKEGPVLNKRIEINAIHRDGREFPVELAITPIRQGDNFMFSAFVRDITERKRAEHATSRLAALVEFSDDAIIGKDLNSVVTSWNAGAERIFGYSSAEMVGQPITRIIPSERQEEEKQIQHRIKRGERIEHFETLRTSKDGRVLAVSVTVSPIKDSAGAVVGASTVARDITERKRELERAAWLASFPEFNPNPIIELDLLNELIHYVNPFAVRLFCVANGR